MTQSFYDRVAGELSDIDAQGLTKPERIIASRQGPVIQVGGREVLNFCANNYLGLAGDERVTQAGIAAQQKWGAGTASVRFICGTLEIHKELEAAIAGYLGFEDAILFAAAFDANGGIFEPLFGENDAIVSDSLNHASIIDGVRLCKAKRYRFANSDMDELETRLKEAREAGARDIIIATDGAFSMDGYIARLKDIRALADRYDALIMVDGDVLRTRLSANAHRYRNAMADAGFTLLDGEHPIIPVMLGDAKLAQDFAARALELGVYVIGFSFPVVPRGQARIRTQMSAAHTFEQIDRTVAAFTQAGRELGVI